MGLHNQLLIPGSPLLRSPRTIRDAFASKPKLSAVLSTMPLLDDLKAKAQGNKQVLHALDKAKVVAGHAVDSHAKKAGLSSVSQCREMIILMVDEGV